MIEIKGLKVGQPIYNYCYKYRVEAVGYDWAVIRRDNSYEEYDVDLVLGYAECNYFYEDPCGEEE